MKIFKKHIKTVIVISIVLSIFLLLITFDFYRYDTKRLIKAIEANDVTTVKQLLEKGVDPNRPTEDPSPLDVFVEYSPKRPLSIACKYGNLEIIQLLIEYGATAEAIDGLGWSPLRQTLFRFHPDDVEVVKLLLANGAEPDALESDELPVFAAAQMRPRVLEPQPDGTAYRKEYDEATAKGITEIVILLLGDTSIDDTMYSRMDRTLLIHAVVNENLYLAEYLISQGCDLTITDCHDKTAMDYALESGNEEMIALLRYATDDSY